MTGQDLAANIAKVCPRWLTLALVSLLVVANTINIAADIGAMAEAARLLVGGRQLLYIVLFDDLEAVPRVRLGRHRLDGRGRGRDVRNCLKRRSVAWCGTGL